VSWLVEIGKINKPTVESGMIVWALKRSIIQCAVWDFSSYQWEANEPVRALKRASTRTEQKKDISSEGKQDNEGSSSGWTSNG